MRLAGTAFLLLSFAPAVSIAQKSPESYWLLLRRDGRTWCGYSDSSAFTAAAYTAKPTETARVTYSAGSLMELTYQIEPESGDWIVVDRYRPAGDGLELQRTSLLTQENRKIVQEAAIDGNEKPHLVTIGVTTLDGKKAKPGQLDYPDVPIRSHLSQFGFLRLVQSTKSRSLPKRCQEFNDSAGDVIPHSDRHEQFGPTAIP